jgi:hypothetical protein
MTVTIAISMVMMACGMMIMRRQRASAAALPSSDSTPARDQVDDAARAVHSTENWTECRPDPRSWKNPISLQHAVRTWANERIFKLPDAEVQAMVAFDDFCRWCECNGLSPCAVAGFGREFALTVQSMGGRKIKKRCHTVYVGCRVNSAPLGVNYP